MDLPASSSFVDVTRELVYGRRPVREALRGPREVLELWASDALCGAEAWLRELDRPRVQTKLERDLSEAAGTRDHQGVVALVRAVPLRRRLRARRRRRRCWRASTRSATHGISAP